MEKKLLQLVFLAGIIVLGYMLWHPFWRFDLNESVNPKNTEKIVFTVERGDNGKGIAKLLKEDHLIGSKKSFLRTIKAEDLDKSLRYGKFVLNPSMTLREIITVLTTQGTGELAITIPEGWTINDIDAKLTELGLINEEEFRNCTFTCTFDYDFLENDRSLEGFLFPDTYFVESSNFSSATLIDLMLKNFNAKLNDQMRNDIEVSGRTIRETMIVASMLEKEVRTQKDIPIVSGIIWKRLDNDWTLGIDATLLYILDKKNLTSDDLAMDSPYNTRVKKGITPTAISNPGLASIKGAIYPEKSEYWFYLTTPDTGEVIYAKTNEEHEANKAKYLK